MATPTKNKKLKRKRRKFKVFDVWFSDLALLLWNN